VRGLARGGDPAVDVALAGVVGGQGEVLVAVVAAQYATEQQSAV
jgi:hypothetical protein